MKKLNFNFKDRKILTLGLCLILVSVFTLTIAYAALNAVLNISGNAEVVASSWDIKLSNPKVANGSVNTDVPTISGNTLSFNTALNMPGDFYEFTVDVVNGGSIDAMINNVIKNPELTIEQSKYLKYEITYQNGESITSKQLLAKDTTVPIKVRIEYRNDLVASELPTTSTTLNLSLTLEYVQSDGTGIVVNNNGIQVVFATGDVNEIGTIVTIGTEQFYIIGTEGDNVKLLSMYNLYVGNKVELNGNVVPLDNPTGLQNEFAVGAQSDSDYNDINMPWYGTTAFSEDDGGYDGSVIEKYINDYKNLLINYFGVKILETRLITYDELEDENSFNCISFESCSNDYPWINSTSYWIENAGVMYAGHNLGVARNEMIDNCAGVRPVIVISKDYF